MVVEVDPGNTPRTCSGCGFIFEHITLKDRQIDCPRCWLSLDRDHNVAINILNRAGLVRWASSSPRGGLAKKRPGFSPRGVVTLPQAATSATGRTGDPVAPTNFNGMQTKMKR
ncbi:MAG: transposase [Chloroflexota bacterium]|nr:transposase [Chloroflexota bacterium]